MCHSERGSRSSSLGGAGFVQANCWGHWGLEGQLGDPFVRVYLTLGLRQPGRGSKDPGTGYRVVVHIVPIHHAYV